MVGSFLLLWGVASSSVATATITTGTTAASATDFDDLLGDLPLSDEEIALLNALDTDSATTAPVLDRPRPWPAPSEPALRRVPRARVLEPAAPSIWGALTQVPVLGQTVRTTSTAQTILLHGLRLDGDTAWLGLDPRFFDDTEMLAHGDLRASSRADSAVVTLTPRAVPVNGAGIEAAVTARSTDRSLLGFLDGYVGGSQLGVRATAAVRQQSAMRIQTPGGPADGGPDRTEVSGRLEGRLLGGDAHAFGLRAGGLILYTDTRCPSGDACDREVGLIRAPRPATVGHGLGFVRADLRHDQVTALVIGGYRTTWTDDDTQHGWQGRTRLDYRPSPQVRLSLGGNLGLRNSVGRRYEGYGGIDGQVGVVTLSGTVRLFHRRFVDATAPTTEILPQVRGTLALGEHASVWVGIARGAHDHPLFGPIRARRLNGVTSSWTADVGTEVRGTRGWWRLRAFATEVNSDCLDARARDQGSAPDGRRLTLESEGTLHLFSGLSTAVVAAWSEQDDGLCRLAVARLRAMTSLRYDFTAGWLQAHLVGVHDGPRLGERLAAPGFVRAGMTGGMALGSGFHFQATVENIFDQEIYLSRSLAAGSGVDLRIQLTAEY